MSLPPEIAARVATMRLEGTASTASPEADEGATEVVQLAVRMPASLRRAVHAVAAQQGCATQEWVNRELHAAVVEARDPQLRLAGRLFDELRGELAQVVGSGAYERYTAEVDDPDLAQR